MKTSFKRAFSILLFGMISLIFISSCSSVIPDYPKSVASPDEKYQDYKYYWQVESPGRDQYGLWLPQDNGVFHDQGDAGFWNMYLLSNMCMMKSLGYKDFDQSIPSLWSSIQTNLIAPDGRPKRYPVEGEKNTISKDALYAWLYMGAIAYHFSCDDVTATYGDFIERVADYGREHNWQMGDPNKPHDDAVTVLADRNVLKMVLKMYGKSTKNLDLATSLHILDVQTSAAAFINNNAYYCNAGSKKCKPDLNVGAFNNHLTYLQLVISTINQIHFHDNWLTRCEFESYWEKMGEIGHSLGYDNWLYWTAYRYWGEEFNTAYRTDEFLANNFPKEVPGEKEDRSIKTWGCSDFIWQRVPVERCNQSNRVYLGNDFLVNFAYSKLLNKRKTE